LRLPNYRLRNLFFWTFWPAGAGSCLLSGIVCLIKGEPLVGVLSLATGTEMVRRAMLFCLSTRFLERCRSCGSTIEVRLPKGAGNTSERVTTLVAGPSAAERQPTRRQMVAFVVTCLPALGLLRSLRVAARYGPFLAGLWLVVGFIALTVLYRVIAGPR
jgi:hypothetical protein